jgi:putative FmdB family regulatory protein
MRARGTSMPMYDYKCLDCGKESLIVLTLKEHETGKVTCPSCKSTKMQQLYTSFIAHTTKKS